MITNPFTSDTFSAIWSKHFSPSVSATRFGFLKNLLFEKHKFLPLYFNYGKTHTKGISYTIENSLSNISAEWEGNVWSSIGAIIPPPAILWNESTRTFSWGSEVVGTIRITGMERYDIWTLDIPPREDSTTESAWSCTVRAFYMDEGEPRIEQLSISEPDTESSCGYHYQTTAGGSDDKCWEITHWLDPCSGIEDESLQTKEQGVCNG